MALLESSDKVIRIARLAFRENAASLRIQEKPSFQHAGEAMLFSNPLDKDMPHVSTVLTRARFAANH